MVALSPTGLVSGCQEWIWLALVCTRWPGGAPAPIPMELPRGVSKEESWDPQRAGVQSVAEGIGVQSNQVTRAAGASGRVQCERQPEKDRCGGFHRGHLCCVCGAVLSAGIATRFSLILAITVQNGQCRFIQDHAEGWSRASSKGGRGPEIGTRLFSPPEAPAPCPSPGSGPGSWALARASE